MLNNHPINILRGTETKINGNKYNITPGLQRVFTETSNTPLTNLNDKDIETYVKILTNLTFENYKAVSGENKSGRYKTSKTIFRSNLKGQGIQKSIIPSNIIDIYTRLEMLLGLKLSGYTDTLSEASAVIDQLYKMGEKQNKTNNNIETLLTSFLPNKWNYLVNF